MSASSRRVTGAAATALMTGAAVVALGGLASARTSHPTIAAAHNAKLHESVLVDSHGFTLYELAPETSHHLLCKSSLCMSFWPPLKAPKGKATKGAGVSGRLGTLRRQGFMQLTLNGRPLYRFAGDSAKGQANGQGIMSFGGTWHAVRVGAAASGSTHTTSTTTTTSSKTTSTTTATSTSSTYSYPAY
jgi:predicted lipoprotein with Yx(FWY)xxD motif